MSDEQNGHGVSRLDRMERLGIVLRGEGFEPTFVSDGDRALDAGGA